MLELEDEAESSVSKSGRTARCSTPKFLILIPISKLVMTTKNSIATQYVSRPWPWPWKLLFILRHIFEFNHYPLTKKKVRLPAILTANHFILYECHLSILLNANSNVYQAK